MRLLLAPKLKQVILLSLDDPQPMKLADAFDILRSPVEAPAGPKPIELVCGFTPLHFATFLCACARLRFPADKIELRTGLYGDFLGTLDRAAQNTPAGEAIVALEWSDLDRRLGLRDAGGWGSAVQADILAEVERALGRLTEALRSLAAKCVVALSPPTLPVPPLGHTTTSQESRFELRLRALVSSFLASAGEIAAVRVVAAVRLEEISPLPARLDVRSALATGFPYSLPHAGALAQLLIDLLDPQPPKKGLITDLDGTLWKGILGEQGVDGVAWDLAAHAQEHALYQQALAALADSGVLIGVASKNELSLVRQALQRKDLLLPEPAVFPVEAHWQPKSASVERILQAWNIGPDSVVFIDDSPMELAEVQDRYPAMTCLGFPRKDPDAVWRLLLRLRALFGKPSVGPEDGLRTASLRASGELRSAAAGNSFDDFLASIGGSVHFDLHASGDRAFELMNKTNQFNLNGRRYSHGEWRAHLESPAAFALTVAYGDKFGPLGKIAVVLGTAGEGLLKISGWVMSCRAFSRRIEHHTLAWLFAHFAIAEMEFDYSPADRNRPLREFFESVLRTPVSGGPLRMSRAAFEAHCPPLHHEVLEVIDGSDNRAPAGVLLQSVPGAI
jgi:FkbH-like protein